MLDVGGVEDMLGLSTDAIEANAASFDDEDGVVDSS